MAKYRTFARRWWNDRACTIPGPGPKRYDGHRFDNIADARAHCAECNRERGPTERGTYGMATEFESF